MLKEYLQGIFKTSKQGDAREESYYPTLKILLEDFAKSSGKKKAHVTVLPKKTDTGNPDFRVWDGKQHITGYIEAKPPTQENLEVVETSEQLKRYLHTFPNLILTNFFQFRLYRNGNLIDSVQIARPFTVHKLKALPQVEKEKEFLELLEKFFAFSLPKTYSAKGLAVELAKRTRFLNEQITTELQKEEAEKKSGFILGFYEAFQKYLIGSLTKEEYADLYAQTITYGLFAARTRARNGFNRKLAYDLIPRTIGILRDVFHFISLGELPTQMAWIVDDIAEVLCVADIEKILRQRKDRDPIVHFYEPFLAEYNPAERERRGVYYTPEPVVSYIVRSVHHILKKVFDRPDGFASASVKVLDPAAGTCTFPAEAARQAVAEFTEKYGAGGKANLIPDHILKNFYAFELMMAPYAVGHLKIGYLLEEFGHPLEKDERFQLYLTNTLDLQELQETRLPGMSSLAEESHLAGKVKKETPILVILGNPPYSGHSANIGEWISLVIKDYYTVDGRPLGEKNPKWLQDDYVKFIRFAQWKIDQAGEGILGFITNHSYLDNPTFRGMRQSLMNTFEQIYLVDLHGNSLKKERCPNGSEDKNVFDIRQGVAIGLFIKSTGLERKVCHADVWGIREAKYAHLETNDVATVKWVQIHPRSPSYFFIPRDEALLEQYQKWVSVTEIFPVNSVGIVTSRDDFVIDFDKEKIKRRLRMFRDKNMDDEVIRETFDLRDKKGWKLTDSRKAIMKDDTWETKIVEILYRPFDVRWVFYHIALIERTRHEVMRHMANQNLGLITPKQYKEEPGAFVTEYITGHKTVSAFDINYVFPLYCYSELNEKDLLSKLMKPGDTRPNLSLHLLEILKDAFKWEASPENIFYFIYAILYSPSYRKKYAGFLKTDFPRVPFTNDRELFLLLANLGEKLVSLHLLKSKELNKPISRFQGKGDNRVEKQTYKQKQVYINKTQYFEGVEPEVWQYRIGGYQVLDKWLKDRKQQILTTEDIKHYCRVTTALAKTIEIQSDIDTLFPQVEKKVIPISL